MAILHDPNLLLGTDPANTIDEKVRSLQTKLFGMFGAVPSGDTVETPFVYDGAGKISAAILYHGDIGTPPDQTNRGFIINNTSANKSIRLVADAAGTDHAVVVEASDSVVSPFWYPMLYVSESDLYHYGLDKYMSDLLTLDDLPGGGTGVQAVIGGVGLTHTVVGDSVTLDITTAAGDAGKFLKSTGTDVMWDTPAAGGGGSLGYYGNWIMNQRGVAVTASTGNFQTLPSGYATVDGYNGFTISTTGLMTAGYSGYYLVTVGINATYIQPLEAGLATFDLGITQNGVRPPFYQTIQIQGGNGQSTQYRLVCMTFQKVVNLTASDTINLAFRSSISMTSSVFPMCAYMSAYQVGAP